MPPTKQTLNITAKGRAYRETDVVSYVKCMLEDVGITSGEFVLTIITRIPSGGSHHLGIEIKSIQRNAIRMFVQYGDNGTRFDCYLSSPEIKPTHLLTLITASKIIQGDRYVRKTPVECENPIITEEVAQRLKELRCQTTRLNEARARVETINLELEKIHTREVELREELNRMTLVTKDSDLIKAEEDFKVIQAIVKDGKR